MSRQRRNCPPFFLFLFLLMQGCLTGSGDEAFGEKKPSQVFPLDFTFEYTWTDQLEQPPGEEAEWIPYTIGEKLDASQHMGQTLWFRSEPIDISASTGGTEIAQLAHLWVQPKNLPGLYQIRMGDTRHKFGKLNSQGYRYRVQGVWPILPIPIDQGDLYTSISSESSGGTSRLKSDTSHRLYIACITGDGNNKRGILEPILAGERDQLRKNFILEETDTLVLGILLLGASLFLLPVYLYKRDYSLAGLGLFLFSLGAFYFFRSELAWYLSGLDNIRFFFVRLSLYLTPLGLFIFAKRLFSQPATLYLKRLIQMYLFVLVLLGGVEGLHLSGSSLLSPWQALEYYLLLMLPVTFAFTVLSFYSSRTGGNRESRIFIYGLLLFLSGSLHDLVAWTVPDYDLSLSHWSLLGFVIVLIFLLISRYFQALEQLQQSNLELVSTNQSMDRFVPRQFLGMLGRDTINHVRLGDQTARNMTILFTDIRSFTELSETMSPEDNFNFINAYLRRLAPIIRNNNGFIDKYMGDAIMALFEVRSDYALRAVIEIQEVLHAYNRERVEKGRLPIRAGAGLHTGEIMLGTVGEEQRMQGTVISDAANLASRLESLTKEYGVDILISQSTLNDCECRQDFTVRYLGRLKVKGKHQPVSLYEVLNALEENQRNLRLEAQEDFLAAFRAMDEDNYVEAATLLEAILSRNDEDQPAKRYWEDCRSRMTQR